MSIKNIPLFLNNLSKSKDGFDFDDDDNDINDLTDFAEDVTEIVTDTIFDEENVGSSIESKPVYSSDKGRYILNL